MKVLVIHYRDDSGGGAESAIRDQARALRDLGHEAILAFSDPKAAYHRHKPDVVHFHTIHLGIGIQSLLWFQEQHIPHCISLHDYWPICRGGGRMLLRHHDQPCNAVTGLCDGDCDWYPNLPPFKATVNGTPTVTFNKYSAEILQRHGIRIDAVIPHGIDTEFFHPDESKRTAEPSIVCVSAWPDQPTKGIHILKRALWKARKGARLVSGVSRERVRDELQAAHISIIPSCYEETFGLTLCESMATGCACIASNVCGLRAQIDHGKTGLLVPPRDAGALAATITSLLENSALRKHLQSGARSKAKLCYNLDKMGRDYEGFYEELLSGGQERGHHANV